MGILEKMLNKIREDNTREETPIDDEETQDKHLRSLRRQKRRQDEQQEKEALINKLKDHEREMTRRNVFGFENGAERKLDRLKNLRAKKAGLKKNSILKQKKLMLSKRKKKQKSIFFK